ncbi:MAG: hypothetical protein ABFS39_09330 [Pseudomonadota bacterium]
MAEFTGIAGLDVCGGCIFSYRRAAIVARETIAGNATMIKSCKTPISGGMTIITGGVSANMFR